jgi:CHAT domain-containing protein
MSARLRVIALLALAAVPVRAEPPPPSGARALAARLLGARDAERERLLGAPGGASVELARVLLELADKASHGADYPRALVAFRTAEGVARRARAENEAALALNGAASILYRQGELVAARRTAEEALRACEVLGDPGGQAEALNTLANVFHARAEYEQALPLARRASDLWAAAGNRRGVARVLNNVGNIHRALSEYDAALTHHLEALRIFEEIGDTQSAAVVHNAIATDYFHRGEYPQSLEHGRRSLAMNEALGDRFRIASSYDALGNVERALGAYARALDLFHRALKLREQIGHKFGVLETWNNIGLAHFSHGNYRLAIDAYKRGLRLNKEMGGTTLLAEALYNIGAAAWRLGDRGRAGANYRESLRVSERGGYRQLAAACLHDLGRMALEDERLAEARGLLQRALETREAIKDRAGVAEALNGLAALSLAAGRPAEGLDRAQRAAEIARRFEQADPHWEAETLTGLAHRALGQPERARRSFEAAVAVIEGLRLQVAGRAQGRQRFFESKLSPYHELIALALVRGRAAEALEMAERSKARVLADLARGGRVDLARAMSPDDKREEARLLAALAAANRKVQAERAKDAPDTATLAALEAERDARRSTYETFQAALHARHPELTARRGQSPVFRLADAEALLASGSAALLEYAVTEKGAYLFVLADDGEGVRLDAFDLGLGRAALQALARGYRERLARRDLAFAEDSRRAFERLLGPARARLRGRTQLVIVPDGPVWDVPFQALQDGAGRYLVETAAVSYVPSLTVLREIVARRRPHPAPPTVLAMGKADFGGQAASGKRLMSGLVPLTDAERQVRLIGELYGPARSSIHVGTEAREDRFKAEAPRHSILHLATHGVLDEASPLYSHVVLSPGATGSSEDGMLEAWEMAELRLDADVAILAACETGRGRVAAGEGIVGTMWALFVAGTQSLVVSQWKVESASTTELMAHFHRGLARGEGAKAEHLRRASRELLRDPRYAHPFYWAGFVLVGNPY